MLIKKERIPLFTIITVGLLPGFIKKRIYRLKGYRIGNNVKFGLGSVLIAKQVRIGDHVHIGFLTILRARDIRIERHVFIGSMTFLDTERIEIGEDTRIREQVYAGGLVDPDSLLKVGKRCLIMQMTYINPTKPVVIGDDSALGGHCLLFTHSSWLSALEGYPVRFGPITIGNKVWIAWRVFITSDVTIGEHVVVGPESLVSNNIPADSIAGGNPLNIKPNIFHRDLPEKKRRKIVMDIVKAFRDYLEHNGYRCDETEHKGRLQLQIRKDKQSRSVIFLNESPDEKALSTNHSLMVLMNDALAPIENRMHKSTMMLSLEDLKRHGTNDVGEEFVRYLSRYGIRFERMDE